MSTKNVCSFELAANNAEYRHAAMAEYTRQRIVLFCCAVAVTIGALAMSQATVRNPQSLDLSRLGAVLLWLVVFRLSAHLQTLISFDKCDKPAATKPTA